MTLEPKVNDWPYFLYIPCVWLSYQQPNSSVMDYTISAFHAESCKQELEPHGPCTLALVIPCKCQLLCTSELLHLLFPQTGMLSFPLVCLLDLILLDSLWAPADPPNTKNPGDQGARSPSSVFPSHTQCTSLRVLITLYPNYLYTYVFSARWEDEDCIQFLYPQILAKCP